MNTVYLNNAATSYPKPQCVLDIVNERLKNLPSGQFRSTNTHEGCDDADLCRKRLEKILGVEDTGRIFFSSGATESLNLIFAGLGINASAIITTVTEHNSVLRPLYNLPGIKGEPTLIECDENGVISPDALEDLARSGRYRVFVLNHCSNVTGQIADASLFSRIAKRYGLLYIIDTSQSAGCLPLYGNEWNADIMVFTGHKSLLGLTGTGGYYVRNGIGLTPGKFGGTGSDSSRVVYDPASYEYEPGTGNSVGISVLCGTAGYILERGIGNIAAEEHRIREYAVSKLRQISRVRILADDDRKKGPVISFVSEMFDPSDLSYMLQNSFGIVTRSGLMCTPFIHRYIGTEKKGCVRISFSVFQTKADIDCLVSAMKEIHEDN